MKSNPGAHARTSIMVQEVEPDELDELPVGNNPSVAAFVSTGSELREGPPVACRDAKLVGFPVAGVPLERGEFDTEAANDNDV